MRILANNYHIIDGHTIEVLELPDFYRSEVRLIVNETQKEVLVSSLAKDNIVRMYNPTDSQGFYDYSTTIIELAPTLPAINRSDDLTIEVEHNLLKEVNSIKAETDPRLLGMEFEYDDGSDRKIVAQYQGKDGRFLRFSNGDLDFFIIEDDLDVCCSVYDDHFAVQEHYIGDTTQIFYAHLATDKDVETAKADIIKALQSAVSSTEMVMASPDEEAAALDDLKQKLV